MPLLAEEIVANTSVDYVARGIAGAAAFAAYGRLMWEFGKYYLTGRQVLHSNVTSSDEPRELIVTSTNNGRRHVFVQNARLRYNLGGQRLTIPMTGSRDADPVLQPHGDSIKFVWHVDSSDIMQVRLALQNDPGSFHITLESLGGIVQTIPNADIQPILRHLFNEFDPEAP